MRHKISILLVVTVLTGCIFLLAGCRARISKEVLASVESLYGYQLNYANGTATLNLIPEVMVKDLYDNFDELTTAKTEHLPLQIRKYAVTDTVYFDYDTDCSIVWDKKTEDVHIEHTDIVERDDFMQKQHK